MKKTYDAVQTQVSGSKGVENLIGNNNEGKIKIDKRELRKQTDELANSFKNKFLEYVDKWYYDVEKFNGIINEIVDELEPIKISVNNDGDSIYISLDWKNRQYDDNFEYLKIERRYTGNFDKNVTYELFEKIRKVLKEKLDLSPILIPVPNEIKKRLLKKRDQIARKKEELARKEEEEELARKEALKNNSKLITAPKSSEQFYLHVTNSKSKLYSMDFNEVGFINFNISSGEIMSLSVFRQFQGKGLGDVLFKTAIDKGCYWLFANGNRAYKMYQKYGFVAIGSAFEGAQYRPIKNEEDFEKFKKRYNGASAMMCLKDKLDKFGLEWNDLQKEIDEFITSKYRGMQDSIEVGDEVELPSGLKAICEDYDDDYYYLRDYNANIVKISRKTDK